MDKYHIQHRGIPMLHNTQVLKGSGRLAASFLLKEGETYGTYKYSQY